MANNNHILLGYGTITVGGVPIGLTRGGGVFAVEREMRDIEADGDYGPVKGRQVIDREVAKLTVNALQMFNPEEINKYYPAIAMTTGAEEIMTSTLAIVSGDYKDVVWSGLTKDGRQVIIELDDCINTGNIEWSLEDKNEVVPSLDLTASYDPDARTTAPWRVKFVSGTTRTVTFTVTASAAAVEGASVYFYNQTILTNASGVAVFSYIPDGVNRPFSVTKGGYLIYQGAVTVDGAESVAVALTAI